jgi:hypothetical protein
VVIAPERADPSVRYGRGFVTARPCYARSRWQAGGAWRGAPETLVLYSTTMDEPRQRSSASTTNTAMLHGARVSATCVLRARAPAA